MPPDPPREQGPPGLATPTQINATPTSKTVENPGLTAREEEEEEERERSLLPPDTFFHVAIDHVCGQNLLVFKIGFI